MPALLSSSCQSALLLCQVQSVVPPLAACSCQDAVKCDCNFATINVVGVCMLIRPQISSYGEATPSTLGCPPRSMRGLEDLQDSIRSTHAPGLNVPNYLHHSQHVMLPCKSPVYCVLGVQAISSEAAAGKDTYARCRQARNAPPC